MKYAAILLGLALFAAACSGDDGKNGGDGANGGNALFVRTAEPAGANCAYGGDRVTIGTDANGDGTLADDEVEHTTYDCKDTTCVLQRNGRCAGADLHGIAVFGDGFQQSGEGDLSGIDLSGADLRHALFQNVDLSNANLSGADLTNAVFLNVLLLGTNLSGAKAGGMLAQAAYFVGVDATDADFTSAFFINNVQIGSSDFQRAKLDKIISAGLEASDTNFTGASFKGALLSNGSYTVDRSSFTNVDFTDASLSGTDWTTTSAAPTLTGANFSYATFFGANASPLPLSTAATFTNAYFDTATVVPGGFDPATRGALRVAPGVDLTGADFSHAMFSNAVAFTNVTLVNANFTKRRLGSSTFQGANLTGANFVGASRFGTLANATLNNADFTDADLSGVTFTGASVVGTNFTRANLTSCTLTGPATGTTFAHATLLSAILNGLTTATGSWSGCYVNGTTQLPTIPGDSNPVTVQPAADLVGKDLSGIWLTGAQAWTSTDNFTNTSFSGAHLGSVNFHGANLTGANFTNAQILGGDLTGCNLSGANFNGVLATELQAAGANFSGANWSNATTIIVVLGGANLSNVNLTNANLTCADFFTASGGFRVTDFTGATIANTTCPDLTVIPSGPSDACLDHGLIVSGGPFGSIATAYTCEVAAIQLLFSLGLGI